MRFKNNNAASLSKKLVAYSVATGAAALGLTTAANAALQVFDYRGAPIHTSPIGNYEVGPIPHDAAILYMDGTFKRSTIDWGDPEADPPIPPSYVYYDQNGDVTTPIDAGDKTADAVWFTYQDFRSGGKAWGGSFLSAGPGGGVAANLIDGELRDGSDLYEVYNSAHATGLEGVATQVDGGLNYTPGYAVVAGGGGQSSYGWGWGGNRYGVKGFWGTGFVGFSLLEEDGLHYGWVEVATQWRVHNMSILGWGYETIPGMAAELTYDVTPISDPGDVNNDGEINADDIDDLCDQIGQPYDAVFDLDNGTGTGTADGVVDEIDLLYLIESLVEWDNGVDTGVGTYQGDFNLDGVVNATDLAIMKGTFGTSGVGYAGGNANCDDVVNATDLAILKGTFGLVAPTGGGVPEPATLSLLALGAAGLAAKRRRRS